MAQAVVPWLGGARAAVSLTFDDARHSQIAQGLPLLARHGLPATFYVSPGPLAANADAWRRALAAGHEIGNHTMTHPCSGNFPWSRNNALEDYTLQRMAVELDKASEHIAATLGVVPRTFAYPCGQTFVGRDEGHASYIPLVRERFLAGRGFPWETHNDPEVCDLAHLAAFFSDNWTLDRYVEKISAAVEHGGWAIFAGHDVGTEEGYQTTRAGELDRLGAWLTAHRGLVWTATVAEVAATVRAARRVP